MIIDNKGRVFGKINIIDACVILVIIIGIIGGCFTVSVLNKDKSDGKNKTTLIQSFVKTSATVTLRVKGVRSMTKDALRVGDELYHTMSDTLVGTITKVVSKPSENEFVANDGSVYKAVVPEKYDLEIKVDVSGKKDKDGFFCTTDELYIRYGTSLEIKTPSIKTTVEIIDIEYDSTGEKE